MKRRRARHRGGWWIIDMITGLAILGVLAAVFAMAVARQDRGKQRLAESRDATRLAEHTLTAIQSGQPPPAPPEGAVIQILPLESAGDASGYRWVRVNVTENGHSAGLTGLLRAAPTTMPSTTPAGGTR